MKAIFELAAPAGRLDRAASAGDAVWDCAVRSRTAKTRDSDERHERHDSRVPAPAAPRALPRLLDQRLDEGLELLAVDGIARARRARRGGDGHGCLPTPIALVLLAS